MWVTKTMVYRTRLGTSSHLIHQMIIQHACRLAISHSLLLPDDAVYYCLEARIIGKNDMYNYGLQWSWTRPTSGKEHRRERLDV